MSADEQDINDIFDNIALTEERICKESYEDGFRDGVAEGNLDGYKLGYAQGVDLGEELGACYGTCVAYLQLNKSEKVKKSLEQLKTAIDNFPKTNDPEADIIGEIQNIRTQYKRVRAMLRLSTGEKTEQKDLSF